MINQQPAHRSNGITPHHLGDKSGVKEAGLPRTTFSSRKSRVGFAQRHFGAHRQSGAGFTLIETLLYIALFGLVISGIVVSAYPLITGAGRLQGNVTAEGETSFVLRRIALAFSSGSVTSVVTTNPAELIINRLTGSDTFTADSGVIELNGVPLTASRVKFSNFSANYVSADTKYVEIEFDAGNEHVGPTRYYVY